MFISVIRGSRTQHRTAASTSGTVRSSSPSWDHPAGSWARSGQQQPGSTASRRSPGTGPTAGPVRSPPATEHNTQRTQRTLSCKH